MKYVREQPFGGVPCIVLKESSRFIFPVRKKLCDTVKGRREAKRGTVWSTPLVSQTFY